MTTRVRSTGALAVALLMGACGTAGPSGTAQDGDTTPPASTDPASPDTRATEAPPEETPPEETTCLAAPYTATGSYVAGVMTLTVDGQPMEVWYPADPGAELGLPLDTYDLRDWLPAETAAKIGDDNAPIHETAAYRGLTPSPAGPFPVVLFSHGLGGYRLQSSFLMAHLATWGFVVAATEHPERGLASVLSMGTPQDLTVPQLRAGLSRLGDANGAGGELAGVLDLTRVGVMGHSMGGAGAAIVAADPEISAWVTLAATGFGTGPDKPAMVLGGTNDALASPDLISDTFSGLAASEKRYVSIAKAGHLAFTDICVIGRDQGGVLQIAMDHGLEIPEIIQTLATDGCRPDDLPAEQAWPVIDHYVTAHFMLALQGSTPAGLTDAAATCFDDKVAAYAQGAPPTPDPEPTDPDPDPEPDPEPEPEPDPDPEPEPEPSDPNAGVVPCGDAECDLSTSVCCVGLGGQQCAASCGAFEAPQACDGPEDCGDGQVCCVGFPSGAGCKASCGPSDQTLCHDDGDCSGENSCNACSFPGSPPTNVCNTGC